MAEEEKERREPADAKSPEAAEKAAEEARARLAENPWTENPDAARVVDEEKPDEAPPAETLPAAAEPLAERAADGEDEEPGENDEGNMSILRHLEELRTRIIRSLIAIAVGSAIA